MRGHELPGRSSLRRVPVSDAICPGHRKRRPSSQNRSRRSWHAAREVRRPSWPRSLPPTYPVARRRRFSISSSAQNLEPFLAYARANYDGGLPRYVEQEFRAYIRCGDFSGAFLGLGATRAATIFSSPSHATAEASARAAAADAWPTSRRTWSIESCRTCP